MEIAAIPEPILDALTALRSRLVARFGGRLARMTLFGSYARGHALPTSDVDVLVVIEALTGRDRAEVYEIGAEVWMDTMVRLAPLALAPEELAELERRERLIALDIAREGIAL